MGTHTFYTCEQCGSVDLEVHKFRYVCKKPGCGKKGDIRNAGKYHGSFSCDFDPPSQSVVTRNKRRQKRKRDE